ncbi:MAG: ATP-binding protein [Cyanobacteria bacterium P01_A01_bin.15]
MTDAVNSKNITCESPNQLGCTVLVVDDSETDRVTYERYLTQTNVVGCSLLLSDCGETGLTMCQQYCPDVILLDYRLPDMDGLEFLQTLYETSQSVPAVIMLTGQGSEQVAVEAMKMGAKDYLIKGDLNAEKLSQTVRRALTEQQLLQTIAKQQQQQQLMASISLRISQSLDVETSLKIAVEGARNFLDCDRALIYQFQPDMNGTIVAESVLGSWSVGLGAEIKDTCFANQGAKRYHRGHKTVIDNIHTAGLTPCHIKMLEQFQVRANLVVPILLQPSEASPQTTLWGLLIAHHCRQTRTWQSNELNLLDDLSVQLAIAIQQSRFVLKLQERALAMDKVNRNLRKASKMLAARNQELDQFAYVASHDLKAPLRAIANLAIWLQEDLADQIPAENQEQLELMRSRVKRLEDFIDGLLRYSRAGRQSLDALALDPLQLLHEIVGSLEVPSAMRVTLPTAAPTLVTEKILLQQVLTNLISNAIKYHHRPDGNITISLKEMDTMVEFTVTDDGPGIAPDYHERIFVIFQTLASRDTIESTGIGLSIVKKLVESQGCELSLTSELGKGSTFSFTWPKDSSQSRPKNS